MPVGEWVQTASPIELASSLIDGNPGVVGVSWQGGGHALEVAEVKTAAQLHADIEATGSDDARRRRDSLLLPVSCRDPARGKQTMFDPAVIDYASGTELLFAGPNSWGTDWDSGWGSYPGRTGLVAVVFPVPGHAADVFLRRFRILCAIGEDLALDQAPDV